MSNKRVVSVYICNLLCLISQVGQNSRGGYYLLGFLKDPSTKKLIRKHFPRTFLHFMSTNISASTTLKTGLCPKMYRSYHLSLMKEIASCRESTCQCRRHRRCRFDPWVGKIPWSGKWQAVPVFLPRKFHGQRSLEGYSPWGHKRVGHYWGTK